MRTTTNLILTILFCVLLDINASAQAIQLQLQNDYTNDGSAYSPSLAIGDVNNDGRPDLATTNRASGGDFIAVHLNNGAGGFSAALPSGSNFSARVVVFGDFNRDGNLDMAVGSDGLFNALNIRLGNGTGNFPTGTSSGTGTDIESISEMVTADFNGDGNLDLLVTKVGGYNTAPGNAVKLLLGDGAGNFPISSMTAYALQFGGAKDIEVADFNVDGRPDVAVTVPNSNILQVLINNGAGGFNAAVNTASVGARKLVTADFNRDCIPDLAVSNSDLSRITTFLGTGTGAFGAPNLIPMTNALNDVAVGDFNRDKKIDVAVRRITATAGISNFTIVPGNGSGGFGTAFELTLPVASSAADSLAVLDANRDGRADIIINRNGGFALYNGNSTLFTRSESDLAVYRPLTGIWYMDRSTAGFAAAKWGLAEDRPAPADFDGDGKTDLSVWRATGYGDPARSYFFILRSSDATFQQEQFGSTGDTPAVTGEPMSRSIETVRPSATKVFSFTGPRPRQASTSTPLNTA
ncbi:MAG: FG-GAP repeat domain-containing protein [Pyrinomonadaceae bacterium]